MKLVIDTNVIISALLKNSVTREILLFPTAGSGLQPEPKVYGSILKIEPAEKESRFGKQPNY